MNTTNLTVADDIVVTLDYLLQLDDGQEIDRSDSSEPFEFIQGHGQIIPGLEKALYGMHVGDEKLVVIEPVEAYGELDPLNFDTVSREMFPPDMSLEEGEQLQLRDADSGEIIQASVSEINGDSIVLDFNHPLAGETLFFQAKVAGLRAASKEELAHGHVHGAGHHH